MTLRLDEVYKISGTPTHTFVKPVEYNKLVVNLRTPGRGAVIEGPSGIGKTTSVNQALNELGITPVRLTARKKADVEYIQALPTLGDVGLVIVDDFHKLDDEIKASIADYMKTLADEEHKGTKLIVVGINDAGDALIRFAADLVNRLDIIKFGTEPDAKIEDLLTKGENALNMGLNVLNEIVSEARGSFYLAQLLAHEACTVSGITDKQSSRSETRVSFELVRGRVFERLHKVFEARTRAFAEGPRMRAEGRAPYLHLLHWLAEGSDWSLSIDNMLRQHPELRGSVSQVVDKGYLEGLMNSNSEITAALHYDPTSNRLTVEDPQYIFYLRNISWSKFAKDIGFHGISFESRYDISLSFAGTDRDFAEALFTQLAEREIEVFYDKNEQHRILAENVEEYLVPIYMSGAKFVVCLLGRDYPKRVWTRIESQAFKERFTSGGVIPVWFDDAPPGVFDETTKIGGLEFSRKRDMQQQVSEFVEVLAKKVKESR